MPNVTPVQPDGLARCANNPTLQQDIHIQVNGEPRTVAPATTVSELLRALKLDRQACAVEINLTLVPKSQHASRQLAEADSLEIVTLVGGG